MQCGFFLANQIEQLSISTFSDNVITMTNATTLRCAKSAYLNYNLNNIDASP